MRGRSQADDSTSRWSRSDWWGVVLEAPGARALALFYADLLGWENAKNDLEFSTIGPPDGVAYLAFQTAPDYVRPVWPFREGSQQMMMHLDFEVSDLDAEHQPQTSVRVLLDPASPLLPLRGRVETGR